MFCNVSQNNGKDSDVNVSHNLFTMFCKLAFLSTMFTMFHNVLQVDWEEYYSHYLVDLLGLDQVGIYKSACLRFSFVKITGTNIETAMLSR